MYPYLYRLKTDFGFILLRLVNYIGYKFKWKIRLFPLHEFLDIYCYYHVKPSLEANSSREETSPKIYI